MNRLLLILIMSVLVAPSVSAQYANVNVDKETVAAMTTAFGVEYETEKYYNEQLDKILKNYVSAEAATATVFASKFLERKALTDIGNFNAASQNYHYRRVYSLVASKIMPKILTVGELMLKNPQHALYWGSYLLKICNETKALCQQFQAVVTSNNSGFGSIKFLEIKPSVKMLIESAHRSIFDWENLQNLLSESPAWLSATDIGDDIKSVTDFVTRLIDSGAADALDTILGASDLTEVVEEKLEVILQAVRTCESRLGGINSMLRLRLRNALGANPTTASLFQFANYSIADWVKSYAPMGDKLYYTQRWYICTANSKNQVLCKYEPPVGGTEVSEGSHWYRFPTSDYMFYPGPDKQEAIVANSESHAGWSREKVRFMNNRDGRQIYTFSYSVSERGLTQNGKLVAKAYACPITVTKAWSAGEEVYEAVFDSYKMDMTAFQEQLQAKVKVLNMNEDGITHKIGSDERRYYFGVTSEKLRDTETVVISVSCNESTKLTEGVGSYKCEDCGSSLSAHNRQCSMVTSLTDDSPDTSRLDSLERDCRNRLSAAQNRSDFLDNQNSELVRQLWSADTEEQVVIRNRINSNQVEINRLKGEIERLRGELAEIEKAKRELNADRTDQTDGHTRLPSVMNDCRLAFNLSWKDAGRWSGYTFIRKASSRSVGGEITFRGTLVMTRKPEYVMGVQIHRAVIEIRYELVSDAPSTTVLETLSLDPSKPEAEREKMVNDRLSAAAVAYPSCQVDAQYIRTEAQEKDDTYDHPHLMLISDRLELAREVDIRLHNIYADLVCIEKMMHYKRSIVDVIRSALPYINDEQGRRQGLVESARKRWLRNAAGVGHSDKYNGKYEERKGTK